ncbi:MAG: hypothetical protein Q7R76_01060 [Candidatus Woesearchaeota archaeon]|nr:hypothetical protein [Candidatus Woesearchaeota archaeon]
MSLTDVTRREFLRLSAALAAGAAVFGASSVAAARPLEELTPTNFSQKVYHNPKPVVVLFYEADTDLKNDGTLEYSHRMEQVVETLADKYQGQVAFFRVAIDHNTLNSSEYEKAFGVPDSSPLTVMYGRFDVLTGQRSVHNFKIDVSKGGPVRDDQISPAIDTLNYWIQQNLFRRSPDGDSKLYRYEGTLNIHEVGELR